MPQDYDAPARRPSTMAATAVPLLSAVGSELVAVELVLPHEPANVAPILAREARCQAEISRRPRQQRREIGLLELRDGPRPADLECLPRVERVDRRRRLGGPVRIDARDADHPTRGQQEFPVQQVLELANPAGPGVR